MNAVADFMAGYWEPPDTFTRIARMSGEGDPIRAFARKFEEQEPFCAFAWAMMVAAAQGATDVLDALLLTPFPFTAREQGLRSALEVSAWRGRIYLVQNLLGRGAVDSLRQSNENKFGTALEAAAAGGHLVIVQMLIRLNHGHSHWGACIR